MPIPGVGSPKTPTATEMSPSLLILAAGLGSRYGGFKQIDPIGPEGEIILDYSIFDAFRAGFSKVVVVTTPTLEPLLREHFARTLGAGANIVYTHQKLDDLPAGFSLPEGRTKPWGTGHAIRAARSLIQEPFGAINADDFYGPGSFQVLADFLAQPQTDYAMVGFRLSKTLSEHGTVSRGICEADASGNLVQIAEHTKVEPCDHGARTMDNTGQWHPISPDSLASMNMWGFQPSLFAELETQFHRFLELHGGELKSEFFIPTVVDTLIQEKKVACKVLRSEEQWFGMTYQEDRAAATATIREMVATGRYPKSLLLSQPK